MGSAGDGMWDYDAPRMYNFRRDDDGASNASAWFDARECTCACTRRQGWGCGGRCRADGLGVQARSAWRTTHSDGGGPRPRPSGTCKLRRSQNHETTRKYHARAYARQTGQGMTRPWPDHDQTMVMMRPDYDQIRPDCDQDNP
eukprot:363824-Chlamydomonas_euryale.AAC.5